jgi:hypothetical protein
MSRVRQVDGNRRDDVHLATCGDDLVAGAGWWVRQRRAPSGDARFDLRSDHRHLPVLYGHVAQLLHLDGRELLPEPDRAGLRTGIAMHFDLQREPDRVPLLYGWRDRCRVAPRPCQPRGRGQSLPCGHLRIVHDAGRVRVVQEPRRVLSGDNIRSIKRSVSGAAVDRYVRRVSMTRQLTR